ncbi:MAG: histidine phosphatase family protein [Oscillospiraceae bacterium]|nr:histidine phosphatase family protein [Oscillospiraceae bacterium]
MISYKIHLIRGADVQVGEANIYLGQSNPVPTSERMAAIVEKREAGGFPPAEKVYTSPLSRCSSAAKQIYPGHQIEEMDALMDIGLGVFEGKTFEELKNEETFIRWLDNALENTPPKGEKAIDFTDRILAALDAIIMRSMKEKTESTSVITHGGVIMALMAMAALPRLPIHNWATPHGDGFTLMTTTQMWTRDRACEAYKLAPAWPAGRDNEDDE